MTFISKEIPTGAINGVNKVYLLANTPEYIDDIFMDGAIYTTFSLTGNILTLTDAPQYSLFVDYNVGGSNIVVTSTTTFGQIKTKVWNLLSQKSSSTTFSSDIIGDEINSQIRNMLKGRVINRLTKKEYRAGKLWFMEAKTNIRYQSGSTLTQTLNLGDTYAYCDTTNLLGTGYVEIGGDIIHYTGIGTDISGNTRLEGVTGQTIEHLETEKVVQLYETPTDIDKIYTVQKIIKGDGIRKIDIPLDNTSRYTVYYNIYRTGTKQLIKIVGLNQDDLITVTYYKKYDNMTNDSDICPLPDDYGVNCVAYIVAGNLGYDKSMPNGERNMNTGYDRLQEMYQYFTNETFVIKQKLQPTAYSFTSIRKLGGRTYQ